MDPGTGAAALLEVARVLGDAARGGWRPERTIRIAFWDAEEYGLVGSTEYVEQFRRQLEHQLLLYVNTDMNMVGHFDPGGVPSLRDFVIDVARSVPSRGARSVFDEWVAPKTPRPDRLPVLKPLGSGADFVPFQDFLGAPTLSIEFIGTNGYGFGTYHSNFDSREYAIGIADPGFAQGAILARTLLTTAVRMANAEVLPFRFGTQGEALVGALRDTVATLHGLQPRLPAAVTDQLLARAGRVHATALHFEAMLDQRLAAGRLEGVDRARLNDVLARIEQQLADDDAAPDRAWFRHVFHGWNIYSLYDGQPFPGLAEAVRTGERSRVDTELQRIARALERMAASLDEACSLVGAPALSTRTSASGNASPRAGG